MHDEPEAASIKTLELLNTKQSTINEISKVKQRTYYTNVQNNPWHFCYMFKNMYNVNNEACWTYKMIQKYNSRLTQLSTAFSQEIEQVRLQDVPEKYLYNLFKGDTIDPDILLGKRIISISEKSKYISFRPSKPIRFCSLCAELLKPMKNRNSTKQRVIQEIKKREEQHKPSLIKIYAGYNFQHAALKLEYPHAKTIYHVLFEIGNELYRFTLNSSLIGFNLQYLVARNSIAAKPHTIGVPDSIFSKLYATNLFFEELAEDESDEELRIISQFLTLRKEGKAMSVTHSIPIAPILSLIQFQRLQQIQEALQLIKLNFTKIEFLEQLIHMLLQQSDEIHLYVEEIFEQSSIKLGIQVATQILTLQPTHQYALKYIVECYDDIEEEEYLKLICLQLVWTCIESESKIEQNCQFLLRNLSDLNEADREIFLQQIASSPLYLLYKLNQRHGMGNNLQQFLQQIHSFLTFTNEESEESDDLMEDEE